MEKFQRMAVLLKLMERLDENGNWSGETHIQKSVYFVQEGVGVPLDFDFLFYHHGPFSFDLRDTLGEMRGTFMVDVVSRPPYGPSLKVSDSGRGHEARFPRSINKYDAQIAAVTGWLGKRDVYEMERLSTALYVQKENPAAAREEHLGRMIELKPHVLYESAVAAYDEVDQFLASAPYEK